MSQNGDLYKPNQELLNRRDRDLTMKNGLLLIGGRTTKNNTDEQENGEEEEPSVLQASPEERVIRVFGPVDHTMSFTIWCALEAFATDNQDEEITLLINSLGGSAHDMFAIADAMGLCPAPIRTIGTGIVASAATLIVASGTPGRRFLTNSCMVMTHDLQWGYYTNLSELQTVAEAGKKMESRYHKMMARRCGKTLKEIRPHLEGQGNWMEAREAIKKVGVADSILPKRELW